MQHQGSSSSLLQHVAAANGVPVINMSSNCAASAATAAASTFLPFEYSTHHHPITYANFPLISGLHPQLTSTNNILSLMYDTNKLNKPTNLSASVEIQPTSSSSSNIIPPPPLLERQSKTNLYIKGLPENFTDEALEDLVPDKLKIKSLKAALEDDMRCKGYGFIDFVTEDDARRALDHIQSRNPQFNAKYAKENEKDKTNLYVTNIPKEWTSKDSDKLKSYFEKFGPIQSAFIMIEKSTNKTVAGVGFVRFVNESDALKALTQIQKEGEYLPNCDQPLEAKYADKHNPETRKRRNPSSIGLTAAMLTPTVSGVGSGSSNSVSLGSPGLWDQHQLQAALRTNNCLINTHNPMGLTNSLYGALISQPLLLRNQMNNHSNGLGSALPEPYFDWSSIYGLAGLNNAAANSSLLSNGTNNTNVATGNNGHVNQHHNFPHQQQLLQLDPTGLLIQNGNHSNSNPNASALNNPVNTNIEQLMTFYNNQIIGNTNSINGNHTNPQNAIYSKQNSFSNDIQSHQF